MKKINVTKSFLPKLSDYTKLLKLIWDSHQLTNNGYFVNKFKEKIGSYINNENF